MGTDEPPGIQAFQPFTVRNTTTVLVAENKFFTEIVMSISYTPGLLILPQAEISFVPVDLPTPIFAYSSPPILIIGTTAAKVSTLFTTVGLSHAPFTAGKGGLILGLPRLPSRAFDQCGFFAAYICTGAAMYIDLAIKAAA
jgi:hypothetical protein